MRQSLIDAYENTAARLVMNFGKTVIPLVQTFANLTSKLYVNPECNQDCAVKCFDPMQFPQEDLYFDQKCFNACGCALEIDKMGPDFEE